MLISTRGYIGEAVNASGKAAFTIGPTVFASEERVGRMSPTARRKLWDYEEVHVEQQWESGWMQPIRYWKENRRKGYDLNRFEEEARAKAGQRLRSPVGKPRHYCNRSRLSSRWER